MTMNVEDIKKDILVVVGGDFSPDSIGPEKHDRIVARVRANAGRYLDVFESMFLGANFDALTQSELYLPALLNMVMGVERDRVRKISAQLVKQLDAVMVIHDAVMEKEPLVRLLPEETASLTRRLEQRRIQLRNLAG